MWRPVALLGGVLVIVGCSSALPDNCEFNHNCFDASSNAGEANDAGRSGGSGAPGDDASIDSGASGLGGSGPADSGAGGAGSLVEGGVSGASGDGGDAAEPSPECSATPVAGCSPNAAQAFFVNAAAVAGGDGSIEAPFATITAAIAAAPAAAVTNIYVCAGTYAETVTLNALALNLHGGFDCDSWLYNAETNLAVINPGAPQGQTQQYALVIADVPSAIALSDLTFETEDAVTAGTSSIAAFVKDSSQVTLKRVALTAGAGVDGANGVLEPFTFPNTIEELKGGSTDNGVGGTASILNMCPAGDTTSGGSGGDGTGSGQDGGDGTPEARGGVGGDVSNNCLVAGGAPGTRGNDATDGIAAPGAGASAYATLTSTGWTPTDGTRGAHGEPGGGGGGGAGAAGVNGGGGGGGGAGGCGGKGGPGGKGAGSSIALLVFNTPVTLEASTLNTSTGGNGGNGVAGQTGQRDPDFPSRAGSLGLGNALDGGCNGGNGAPGGNGGFGGGGAGGVSVGIVWSGEAEQAPTLDETSTVTTDTAGTGGDGSSDAQDGIPGATDDVLEME